MPITKSDATNRITFSSGNITKSDATNRISFDGYTIAKSDFQNEITFTEIPSGPLSSFSHSFTNKNVWETTTIPIDRMSGTYNIKIVVRGEQDRDNIDPLNLVQTVNTLSTNLQNGNIVTGGSERPLVTGFSPGFTLWISETGTGLWVLTYVSEGFPADARKQVFFGVNSGGFLMLSDSQGRSITTVGEIDRIEFTLQ